MLNRQALSQGRSKNHNTNRLLIGLAPRLVLLVALTALVSSGVVGYLAIRGSRGALKDRVLVDFQSQADLASDFTSQYVRDAQSALTTLANLPGMNKIGQTNDNNPTDEVLEIFRSIAPAYQSISIFNPSGDVLARSTATSITTTAPANVSDREWFVNATTTRRPYLGLPSISRGNNRPIINYAIPIMDGDNLVAVMSGAFSLDTLSNAITHAKTSPEASVTLVDQRLQGTIIADSDATRIMQPFNDSADARSSILAGQRSARSAEANDGSDILLAVTPVGGLPWALVVQKPSSVAFAGVGKFTRHTLLFATPVVVLACLISALLALQVVRPLSRLRRAALAFAAGDLRGRLRFRQRDEVGELGRAFDSMADALNERTNDLQQVVHELTTEIEARQVAETELQASHAKLETRVQERTVELGAANEELRRSNSELEQFAYVASHDLQEPLRMVSNYTQLLARRYKDRLDEDADTFIGFAVEGAGRMQQLINDLLDYSRVSTKGRELAPVDCNAAMGRALLNLRIAIEESGVEVDRTDLPTVLADEVQLVQLFQNLVGNAIKFRNQEAPRVMVSAERDGRRWTFAVKDNGIGIDPAYAERIFVIFQRLHTRADYVGTGIGLAVCKRIVERHKGRIWVESVLGEGATFRFTLPVAERLAKRLATNAEAAA